MREYLLSISIGPVQDFIAAARRTRDLAYGSYLLSEVSKACARHLKNSHKATLIFPTPVKDADLEKQSSFMAVNKLLVRVSAEDEAGMRAIAKDCREHVRTYLALHELDNAMDKAASTLGRDGIEIDRVAARSHLEALSEFFAAWAELGPGPDGYPKARDLAESRMAARKTLRDFTAHDGKAGLLKSSLDGYRETVLERPHKKFEKQYFVRWDEQLDGIGLLKRFGGNRGELTFDSTSDVAAAPYVQRIKETEPAVWDEYQKFLADYSETVPKSNAYLYPHASRQIGDPALQEKLDAITGKLRRTSPAPPYYAMLIGDGDNMGKAISGETLMERHQALSKCLSEFAAEIKRMFKGWKDAECVYAGGDDVMALLPLHRALDYSKQIRETFNSYMKDWNVTFSAGLVVAHALEPLDEVRRLAEMAEKRAKAFDGKDALAIIVSPRSGADVGTSGRWKDVVPTVEGIARLYLAGKLSKGFGHELRTLLARWKGDKDAEAALDDALPGLARAIAQKKEFSKEAEDLVANVKNRKEIQFLVDNLFAARPFARAMLEAEGKK